MISERFMEKFKNFDEVQNIYNVQNLITVHGWNGCGKPCIATNKIKEYDL
jgi:hypothetical protein